MNSCIPEPVKPIIKDYISLLNRQLPGRIIGFYLVGSIALGEFNESFSDIDFVATLNKQATSKEIEAFRSIHRTITKKHSRWEMSGSYILPFTNPLRQPPVRPFR